MIGKDLTILEFNRAAARMVYSYYGFHLTKGMSLKVLADAEKQGLWASIYKNIMKKRSFKTETQYDLPDKTYKIYSHHFKPVHNDQDEMIDIIFTSRDVTEMKIAQQTLLDQKLNRQKQITKATIRAQEKERSHIGKELHDNINQILTTSPSCILIWPWRGGRDTGRAFSQKPGECFAGHLRDTQAFQISLFRLLSKETLAFGML